MWKIRSGNAIFRPRVGVRHQWNVPLPWHKPRCCCSYSQRGFWYGASWLSCWYNVWAWDLLSWACNKEWWICSGRRRHFHGPVCIASLPCCRWSCQYSSRQGWYLHASFIWLLWFSLWRPYGSSWNFSRNDFFLTRASILWVHHHLLPCFWLGKCTKCTKCTRWSSSSTVKASCPQRPHCTWCCYSFVEPFLGFPRQLWDQGWQLRYENKATRCREDSIRAFLQWGQPICTTG